MTSLIKNVSSVNTVKITTEEQDKPQAEIKPEIKEAEDRVEIKGKKKTNRKTGKIIGTVAAVGGLIGTAATLAVMIGKNPAKAAKVLKGNLHFSTSAYEDGSKIAEEILAKKGDFSITPESVINLFKDTNKPNKIAECPKELLPNDGVFYHGTSKAKKVYETGFTPFASNQLANSGRELGAGIYVAPDTRVAAAFSGLTGNIIPVKLAAGSKIALVTEDIHKLFFDNAMKLIAERYPVEELNKLVPEVKHAVIECTMRNLFKQAGYDAAYIPKGVKAGGGLFNFMTPDINKVIGVDQKQLVIFSPEKLEIVPRTFIQRVGDLKDKLAAFISAFKYGFQHPLGF